MTISGTLHVPFGAQVGGGQLQVARRLLQTGVRIVGAGNIGSRYASFAKMLGADVAAWDPFATEPCFHRAGSRREFHLDRLVQDAEIFAPMLPLTESTEGLVTAAHIVNFATIGDPHFDNQTNPFFYRLTPSDALQGKALGYYAATHGLTHAAAVFTSDLGAQTSVPPLRAEYKKLGHKLVADLTLAPGASSYRTEVEQVISAHPDALIAEMDPQSEATFLSEYQQLSGHLPLIIGTERTATSDVLTALRNALGVANVTKYLKTITPYVGLSGPGYQLYKKTLLGLSSKIPTASQYVGHPYTISDFDAITITALAMNEAHSTVPSVYNKFVVKVTAPAKGATVVHSYAQGLAAIKAHKTIQYVGASGPLVFDKYHSAGRSFSFDKYDAPTKSMVPVTVIPGTALNG